jgi:hypothetical protein
MRGGNIATDASRRTALLTKSDARAARCERYFNMLAYSGRRPRFVAISACALGWLNVWLGGSDVITLEDCITVADAAGKPATSNSAAKAIEIF